MQPWAMVTVQNRIPLCQCRTRSTILNMCCIGIQRYIPPFQLALKIIYAIISRLFIFIEIRNKMRRKNVKSNTRHHDVFHLLIKYTQANVSECFLLIYFSLFVVVVILYLLYSFLEFIIHIIQNISSKSCMLTCICKKSIEHILFWFYHEFFVLCTLLIEGHASLEAIWNICWRNHYTHFAIFSKLHFDFFWRKSASFSWFNKIMNFWAALRANEIWISYHAFTT